VGGRLLPDVEQTNGKQRLLLSLVGAQTRQLMNLKTISLLALTALYLAAFYWAVGILLGFNLPTAVGMGAIACVVWLVALLVKLRRD